MRDLRIIGSLVAALAALAMSAPASAQGAGGQPPELLMSVGIGPDNTLDNLRAFANAMQPGVGGMLSSALLRQQIARMTTATSLDGLDEKGTIYVLAVDGGPALKGAAVAGKIADEKRLAQSVGAAHLVKRNGWAVIGPKLVAEKVAPFATGTLAGQAISGPPVATIYAANLTTRYKTEIADARQKLVASFASTGGGQMSAMGQLYFDGLFSMLGDSERVIVTFDVTKDVGAIDVGLVPKAGTRLAKFIGLQQPSDYAIASQLPATQAPVLVAGHFDAGPYRQGLFELTTMLYGTGSSMASALDAVFKVATGDFVMAMTMGGPNGMEVTQLFGVTDNKAADKAVGRLLDAFKKPVTASVMGMTTTNTLNPSTTTHDGVSIRGVDVTYDLSKATPENRAMMEKMVPKNGSAVRVALFDKLGAVVSSASPTAVTAAIDAARGKGKRYAPTAQVADFLAGSRTRKESLAAVMDLGAAVGAGPGRVVMMSMGFADKRAHFRFALPAATVRAFAGAP